MLFRYNAIFISAQHRSQTKQWTIFLTKFLLQPPSLQGFLLDCRQVYPHHKGFNLAKIVNFNFFFRFGFAEKRVITKILQGQLN